MYLCTLWKNVNILVHQLLLILHFHRIPRNDLSPEHLNSLICRCSACYQIGDQRPSEFYACMYYHTPVAVSPHLLVLIWFVRLPMNLQDILRVQVFTHLSLLLEFANQRYQPPYPERRRPNRRRENFSQILFDNFEWYQLNHLSPFVYVVDRSENAYYLVDTGCDYSFFPKMGLGEENFGTIVPAIMNGLTVNTYGIIEKTMSFGCSHQFIWQFMVADVGTAVLGQDFITAYDGYVHCLQRTFWHKLV